jgi:cellulose synthase/poly-beta-1,6-N-acetylglucosamine synthase-like glycosyltransferase
MKSQRKWSPKSGKPQTSLLEAEKQLAQINRSLRKQRAEQAAELLRIDWETEELKRQLAAARTRVRYLRQGIGRKWAAQAANHAQQQKAQAVPQATQATQAAAPTVPEPPPQPAAPRARLGDQLIRDGVITEAQLNMAMERQQQFGGRLGDILIELGFATHEQLIPYIMNQKQKSRLGDMLIQMGYLTPAQLEKALNFQRKSGGMLGDILLSLQFIEPEQLYRAIANQNSIGRVGQYTSFDDEIKLPEPMAREYGVVIIHKYTNRYLAAVSDPLTDERKQELEAYLKMPIEQVLASKGEMELFWAQAYGNEMLEESTSKLAVEQPHNSASTTFTRPQLVWFGIIAFIIFIGLIGDTFMTLIALNVLVQTFYFFMTLFKFLIILYGSSSGAQYRFSPEEISQIDERDLPVYTILVPMYKESEVMPQLIKNLERLDYPKAKLDVRLLIENDDVEAQELLKNMKLPSYYSVLVVPDSLPKTKPKACNYGLIRARGEYVVIFDAEDRPDPDQLKKVYLTFKACPENTACVQAKLNYFNSEQNVLTRWFTQEYSMWFELLLPGIMRLDIPIPLGGTSNHFKTSVLKELNAWDPYNVTEDADLGIRLYKEGYKTTIVDSRTWEEANSRFGNWIRQRSRWIKGYMQTWLVHMRHPVRLWKDIGTKGFLGFQVMVLATPVIPLLNPLFWLMVILWFGWELDVIAQLFPGLIYYLASFELLLGNFFFVYSNIAGVYWIISDLEKKQEKWIPHRLVKYALISPLYWVMMTIASYKAAWQLITKPFYWEKTTHGLDQTHNKQDAASSNHQHSA